MLKKSLWLIIVAGHLGLGFIVVGLSIVANMGGTSWVGPAIKLGAAGYAAYSAMRTRNTTTATNYGGPSGGSVVSRRRKRTGRVKRRTAANVFKNLLGSGNELIVRWQNSSQTYLGPGSIPIGWLGNSVDAYYRLPIHMMSLSMFPYGLDTAETESKGCRSKGMCYFNYDPVPNPPHFGAVYLPSQQYDGTIDSTGSWHLEKYDGSVGHLTATTNWSNVFHKWSDIRINMYGAYDVPVKYQVKLLQIPAAYDYAYAVVNDGFAYSTEQGQMLSDIMKPLLYNSVNTNPSKDWLRECRVIKTYSCTIQPLNFSDQRAERLDRVDGQSLGHTGGHVHELRWFIRHDRYRDYAWDSVPYSSNMHGNMGTWDVIANEQIYCDVEPGKKLIMMITATCPMLVPTAQALDGKICGSLDVNVRNCFIVNKN